MTSAVYVKAYGPPDYNAKEILRYAGIASESPEMAELARECLKEIPGKLTYKVCYREFPLRDCGEYLDLAFARTSSAALRKNLQGCDGILLFAATVGIELDRLTARYGAVSPAKALMFQAIGAERIEALCELFSQEICRQKQALGRHTRPRFSPGYGDLPMEIQRDIFQALDCPRKIGLTLNESLLMSPSKSVTAIIGVGREAAPGRQMDSGCKSCGNTLCAYRERV